MSGHAGASQLEQRAGRAGSPLPAVRGQGIGAHRSARPTELQLRQRFTHDRTRALDIFRRVRCGNESGLKLRWRKVYASL